ncbi:hypothetical protein [Flavobacterium wongokense]|uniref:hypothetical protein n=1 Tax=Flavobacterium wongokense TaxID=2910674 RepID=UPI001F1E2A8C|nr:hypothetical protein [Flavobacterium sp. WG47]MCF6131299.1 hypothetical protein [Flavobacterium sp. WG47]
MKKLATTFGLLALMLIVTSFTTPEIGGKSTPGDLGTGGGTGNGLEIGGKSTDGGLNTGGGYEIGGKSTDGGLNTGGSLEIGGKSTGGTI